MDFDRIIDRSATLSLKWDNPKNAPGIPDIIPLWVADMDFAPPPAVLEAVRRRAEHPIFGYTRAPRGYFELVAAWYRSRQGIGLGCEDISLAPAVMPAVSAALRAFTEKGEGVMIFPPVYRPFFDVVEENDRVLVQAPLALRGDGGWEMDFDGMERAARAADSAGTPLRAIIVSSPHNPVGRVWSEAELDALLSFARGRDLAILCDEIHSDIILGERPFVSMASVEGERARKVVVLSGPNKTFNIAGLHISQAIARDHATAAAMRRALSAAGGSLPNAFSLAAAMAAYREGGPWLDELLGYLRGNLGYLAGFLASRLPGIGLSRVEGSYLAWLDFRLYLQEHDMGTDEAILDGRLEERGRVKLSPGSGYGKDGAGYFRVNLACPRAILTEGLERMARTLG
jgi:cysteine-S-conjugate beta-lyase